jgi:hypothetical protein
VPWTVSARDLAVADFDGDGLDDVAQCGFSTTTREARVLTCRGGFTFTSESFPLAFEAYDIDAADLDGDGWLDVGAAGGDFLINDGSGGFTPTPFETSSQLTGFEDLDDDGLPEIILGFGSIVSNRTHDPERTRRGNVNAAAGALADVLLFNGSRGLGAARRIEIGPGDPATLTVDLPPSRLGKRAKFALYEWEVELPGSSAVNRLPLEIGYSILRAPKSPLSTGSLPTRIWNNAGRHGFLGTPDLPSEPAPSTVFALPGGFGVETTLVYQGIIVDPDAPNGRGGMTNAIEVVVR